MTSQTSRIPTLDKLGATIPADLDVNKVASEWFQSFATHMSAGSVNEVIQLFVEDAIWRDLLALTWEFRSFDGAARIKKFLLDRLPYSPVDSFKLKPFVRLQKPFPDLAWIIVMFEFETDVGLGSGVFRLVPTSSGAWKAHTMFTNLEDLKGFPEKTGKSRSRQVKPGVKWDEDRRAEIEFEDSDPAVLIIGGGQSGLEVAARLKFLDVPALVIENEARIGDTWRNRYDALCLHFPVCEC